jgi:hypothetical protein
MSLSVSKLPIHLGQYEPRERGRSGHRVSPIVNVSNRVGTRRRAEYPLTKPCDNKERTVALSPSTWQKDNDGSIEM